MKVTVKGSIVVALVRKGGVSSAGKEWASQDFVLAEAGSGELLKFNVFGADNLANYDLKVNDEVEVTLSIVSREYQGKYYTDARAVSCTKMSSTVSVAAEQSAPEINNTPIDEVPF